MSQLSINDNETLDTQAIHKEETRLTKKHMKRYSALKIKTTVRYHSAPSDKQKDQCQEISYVIKP